MHIQNENKLLLLYNIYPTQIPEKGTLSSTVMGYIAVEINEYSNSSKI